jgi:hypothetical protein
MVWEFKQQLFISQRRVSPQAVADLSSLGITGRAVEVVAHVDLPPELRRDRDAIQIEDATNPRGTVRPGLTMLARLS